MTEQNANFDINALLDGTLDDLADRPEFKPYPKGAHRVLLKLEVKKIGQKQAVEASFIAEETMELADPENDAPLEKGAKASVAFLLDNEYGQGDFKKVMAAAAGKFGAKTNRELMEDCQNAEVVIITGLRQNKEKTQTYVTLEEINFI